MSPDQWEEILGPKKDDFSTKQEEDLDETKPEGPDDDIFYTPDSATSSKLPISYSRERRTAYLIIRCLQGEGIL